MIVEGISFRRFILRFIGSMTYPLFVGCMITMAANFDRFYVSQLDVIKGHWHKNVMSQNI